MASRIKWTTAEINELANTFVKLRAAEPFERATALLTRAQVIALPVEQRRDLAQVSHYPPELATTICSKLAALVRPVTQTETPEIEPGPGRVEPNPAPQAQPERSVADVLSTQSPGTLIGLGIDKLFARTSVDVFTVNGKSAGADAVRAMLKTIEQPPAPLVPKPVADAVAGILKTLDLPPVELPVAPALVPVVKFVMPPPQPLNESLAARREDIQTAEQSVEDVACRAAVPKPTVTDAHLLAGEPKPAPQRAFVVGAPDQMAEFIMQRLTERGINVEVEFAKAPKLAPSEYAVAVIITRFANFDDAANARSLFPKSRLVVAKDANQAIHAVTMTAINQA